MTVSEQETESTEQVPPQDDVVDGKEAVEAAKEVERKKLGSLTAVELVVNEYATKFADKHRVKKDSWVVCLVTRLPGVMAIKSGPVVQVVLLWPDAQPNINTLLADAFKTISRKKMVDGMAIESVLHIKKRAEERRAWVRKTIGSDEADIILDLIPKQRIRVQVSTTVTYSDMVTGESLTITHADKPEAYRGTDVASWLKLSRQVRLNHEEEATRYDNQPDNTEATATVCVTDSTS